MIIGSLVVLVLCFEEGRFGIQGLRRGVESVWIQLSLLIGDARNLCPDTISCLDPFRGLARKL